MNPGVEVDTALARGISEGNRNDLERVINRQAGDLYRYVLRRLGPDMEAAASAITTQTFYDAVKKMRRYGRSENAVLMRLWLIRLANRSITRYRKQGKKQANAGWELENVRAAIAALPGPQGAAAALALFEEMPAESIAVALGVSQGKAMAHLRRALKHLAEGANVAGGWTLDG